MFFLTPNKNMFTGKLLVNSERFLAVLSKRIIFNVKWVEIHKMSDVFERNFIVKWKIFFGKKFEIKKNLWWCLLDLVDEYKNSKK